MRILRLLSLWRSVIHWRQERGFTSEYLFLPFAYCTLNEFPKDLREKEQRGNCGQASGQNYYWYFIRANRDSRIKIFCYWFSGKEEKNPKSLGQNKLSIILFWFEQCHLAASVKFYRFHLRKSETSSFSVTCVYTHSPLPHEHLVYQHVTP